MKINRALLVLLAGLLLMLGAGLLKLFGLRLEAGDIYPPYSSLRADPVGAKGLFEGLEQLPGMHLRRNYEPLNWIEPAPRHTWMFLGASREAFQTEWPEERKLLEGLLTGQSRVVISFLPEHAATGPANQAWRFRAMGPPAMPDKAPLACEEAWGFGFAQQQLPLKDEVFQPAKASRQGAARDLPTELNWHTSLVFTNLSPAWRVVYARAGQPVIIERPLGNGILVLASDSYLFSNEALRFHRQPDLLAWFVGNNSAVVFDETHLGVDEAPGMGTLLRRYRLQGVLGAVLLLGILLVWKNATRLAPPRHAEAADGHVTGRDATQGFVNLLRREIAPRDLPRLCLEEWKHQQRRGSRFQADRLARMEAIVAGEEQLSPRARNPVAAYQQLARIAAEKANTTRASAAAKAVPSPVTTPSSS